jgi:hypothetical protein
MPTTRDSHPDDIADYTSQLVQARGVNDLIRVLEGRTAAQYQVQFSYLAGLAIAERWPSEWRRALDCLLASLARCTETFRDSLNSDNLEWAGCAASLALNRFSITSRGTGDDVMRKLSSFAYYSLSCIIRDAERRTANALMARAALMRGPAARHVDGPWREAPQCLTAMCAAADDHDAIVRWREEGFADTTCSFFNGARPRPEEPAPTMDITSQPGNTLGDIIDSGRAIHEHLYESRGSCFERGYYNIFNIADISSLVTGWTAG